MDNSGDSYPEQKNITGFSRGVRLICSVFLMCGFAGYSIYSYYQTKSLEKHEALLQQDIQALQDTLADEQEDIEALQDVLADEQENAKKDIEALKSSQTKDFEALTAAQDKNLERQKADQEKILGAIKDGQNYLADKAMEINKLSSQIQSVKEFITDEFDSSAHAFTSPLPYAYFLREDWKKEVKDVVDKSHVAGVAHSRVIANGANNTFVLPGTADLIIDGIMFSGIDKYDSANHQSNTIVIMEPGLVGLPHDTLTITGDSDKDTILLDACLTWKKAGKDKTYMIWKAADSRGEIKTVKISKGINAKVQEKCDTLYLRPYQLETELALLKRDNPALLNNFLRSPDRFYNIRGSSFGGIGLVFGNTNPDTSKGIPVTSVLPNYPGDKAGLKAGDNITKIDGMPVSGMSLQEAINKMRGPVGVPVTLTYIPKDQPSDNPKEAILTRELINAPMLPSGSVLPSDLNARFFPAYNSQFPITKPSWPENLPVAAGASRINEKEDVLEQTVRLVKTTEVRQGDDYVWVAGRGSARINGGESIVCGPNEYSPPDRFEITIQESRKDQYPECVKLLNAPEANHVPVDITGNGMFATVNGVRVVKLQSITSCQKANIQGVDFRLGFK